MLELIKVKYDQDIKKQLEKRFIAFDVETTGLNPKEERIIELGAVLFENGQAVQKFNTSFLKKTFDRLQLTGKICYVDTLQLSRKYIHGPYNYKQGTIAHYLHIKNENAHRAYDDAYVCGQILNHIVKGSFQ